MQFVIVDTDVVSYAFKRDSRSALYEPHLRGKNLCLSFMTIAELDQWAMLHNWGARKRQELEVFLQPYTVLESDRDLCRQWARVKDQVQRNGLHIETADAWIAATATLYQIPLVTNNRLHFSRVPGLQLISEAPI